MEQFTTSVSNGLAMALTPSGLFWIFLGVFWGIIGGALPGVATTVSIAMVFPLILWLKTTESMMFIAGIMLGVGYGGAIPAVLIRTPGIPSAVLTVIEGNQLHLRGEGGKALGIALLGGSIGQVFSTLGFIAFVIPIAEFSLRFNFPEMFALALLGLVAAASLTGKNAWKGLVAALFGVAVTTVGVDPMVGKPRFTLGIQELTWGIDIIPVLIGVLAFSQVFLSARQMIGWEKFGTKFSSALPSLKDIWFCNRAIALGTLIGFWFGIVPGAGATVASFVSYQQVRYFARKPELWGKGSYEALAAVETSNNAVIGGDLVPTVGIGIPGAGSSALILAILMLKGVNPGPLLMQRNPEVIQAFFGGQMIGTFAMTILGLLLIKPAVLIATVKRPVVTIVTAALCTVGVYAVNWSLFDVWVALIFGVIGYFMFQYGYSPAALALGVVLGNLMEDNLRRGLAMTGSVSAFLSRPFTTIFLVLVLLALLYPFVLDWWGKRRLAGMAAKEADAPVTGVADVKDPPSAPPMESGGPQE